MTKIGRRDHLQLHSRQNSTETTRHVGKLIVLDIFQHVSLKAKFSGKS